MSLRALPGWADWAPAGAETPGTVGIEEEVMLLDPTGWNLASSVDRVLEAAGPELSAHLDQETHGAAVELSTDPHPCVADAVAQLTALRADLRATLGRVGLRAGCAGTHPFATWQDIEVSAGPRQQAVHASMRELARREPTFALHVHVALPDPDVATRTMNRMRAHVPLLLALSANSPYFQGRDSGLASARTPVFGGFPRSGLPRTFASYDELVEATDTLIRCGALPEPSFIWWDLRLQPRYGTLEVRAMDAQARPEETAALAALTQALVVREAEPEGLAPERLVGAHEVLEENRFLALRDGVEARFVDPEAGCLVPVQEVLRRTLAAVVPHSADRGGEAALSGLGHLVASPGPARQRAAALEPRGLISVVADLAGQF